MRRSINWEVLGVVVHKLMYEDDCPTGELMELPKDLRSQVLNAYEDTMCNQPLTTHDSIGNMEEQQIVKVNRYESMRDHQP